MNAPSKLRLGPLTALVVGSMVGGGIFSLPQNTAAGAGVGGGQLTDMGPHGVGLAVACAVDIVDLGVGILGHDGFEHGHHRRQADAA